MIYVIIPVHNRLNFTINCLKSLHQQTYKNYRIIIVDDGSTDDTAGWLSKHQPEITVLKGNGNLWWTASINMAIRHILVDSTSVNDFIITLNNDLVVNKNYFKELLSIYNKNAPCLVGSVSVDIAKPDDLEYLGIIWNPLTAYYKPKFKLPASLKEIQSKTDQVESDLLWGRGVLIPIEAIRKLGMYDERKFPHYMADEDFSARAKKAGYKILVSTRAVVFDHVNHTGLNEVHRKKNLRFWRDFFFSRRSACNITNRFHWARKHGRVPPLYFAFDMSRICLSQIKKSKLVTQLNNLLH